jgi:hypothetical protein
MMWRALHRSIRVEKSRLNARVQESNPIAGEATGNCAQPYLRAIRQNAYLHAESVPRVGRIMPTWATA